MRAIVLSEAGLVFDPEYPTPSPTESEALIRVHWAGICSTDLELIRGYYNFRGILGHEFVGVVEQCSDSNWIGRRVVSTINFADPNSIEFAEYGLEHHPRRTVLGIFGRNGAMADYVTVPTFNLLAVPDNLSDEQAVFTEPLAAALRIAEQIVLQPSQPVAVIGPGRLGLLVGQVLALRGAELTMLGRSHSSLELARKLSLQCGLVDQVETSRFATVVECTGSPNGLEQAIRITKPRGTLILKSTYEGMANVSLTKVVVDEISIVGSRCGPFAPALRLLSRGQVNVEWLIDGRYSADRAIEAFNHAAQSGVRKILLQFF